MAALGIAAALVGGLAACSDNPTVDQGSAAKATSATDISFAQSMIPHHQQAVEMADMALDPAAGASPEVRALATDIKSAQDPEIEQMSRWLDGWGQPTAMPGATSPGDMPGMDHSGHDMGGMTVSGMMTDEDMQTLAGLTGPAFDEMWLQLMIDHHEGAVAMADQVAENTLDPDVAALAGAIITAQEEEIAAMQGLLGA